MTSIRIVASRGFAGAAFGLLLFTGSRWQGNSPWICSGFLLSALLLVSVASAGRLWCSLHIAGNKNKRLVTTGPYSICRNPLYFFSLIGLIGIGLATSTFMIPALLILSFFLYYPLIIRKEESTLQRLFPEEYGSYATAVPQLIPRHFQIIEPFLCEVNPRIFRSHVFSVVWFVPTAGVLLTVSRLQAANIVPIYWSLF